METFGHIVTLLLIAIITFIPVYMVIKGNGFFKSLIISLPLCCMLVVAVYWWYDIYPDFRLEMMGYDFNGMNDAERLKNVPQELREEATNLYSSRFGVGWPFKAMFGAAFIGVPYVFLVLSGATAIRKFRKNVNNT
ncbi:MAG: hypothetical protein OEY38_23540 [Gammaproteobacteria bacterium]|nr:hypothetical protein [Gammaproteobacteria bacterium]